MERSIVHMDLDTFFVSCVRLQHPELEGIPLIVGGGDRGVVASCSYEARRFGVRSAMSTKMALRLCPEAKIVKGDMELFSRYFNTVTEIIEEKAPVVEKASFDEHYVDITGMERFDGAYKWTSELAAKVTHETGLPISFALSVNRFVFKERDEISPVECRRGLLQECRWAGLIPKICKSLLSNNSPYSINRYPACGFTKALSNMRLRIHHPAALSTGSVV